jgi:hypothetical protein
MGLFAKPEPEPYSVAGRELLCVVCDHNLFRVRSAQLNTPLATFFGWDWANESAFCVVCARCGFVHWFLPQEPID